jgi:NAD(P)-dependent dehydrogenase (short-subunit alcohol dehydrogenase family)
MNQNYPIYPYIGITKRVETVPLTFPPQHQEKPGFEWMMSPPPIFDYAGYKGSGKLQGKTALITGGDSGIGRAAAVFYAKEGADLSLLYLNEHRDAQETKQYVERLGARCLLLPGDLRYPITSLNAVTKTMEAFGKLDIVVNNAAVAFYTRNIMDVSDEQLDYTFRTNVFPLFYMTKAALPYLKRGSSIINTTSRVAYKGHINLIDYSVSKGAVVTFTRTMAISLINQGIRVNAVAPGPTWTPINVSTWSAEQITTYGADTPMGRAAQPFEIAPAFVYLASDDSVYVTGQVIHVNGGEALYS